MRKPQSRRELGRKLREWEAGEEEIEAICDRMEELGYLNEPEYAGRIVQHYARKGFGERKIRDSSTAGASPGNCGTRPWRRLRRRTTSSLSTHFWRKS